MRWFVGGLSLFFVFQCKAQIMSVDLGHEFFKIALMRQGAPLEIVLNPHSKRKTSTAVSFFEAVRTFGDDALPAAGKAPAKVPLFFHSQLAHNFTDDDIKSDGRWWKEFALGNRFYSYELGWNAERGVPTFLMSLENELVTEEVLANILYFAKTLAETSADGKPVKDAVVTIPASANLRYRQSIVAAGEIAGLRVLTLVHEGSAFAVQRATAYAPEKGNVEKALIFNMGSRKTEATIVSLESRQAGMVAGKTAPVVTVLGSAISMKVGGHLMDLKMAEVMLARFQEKHPNFASGIAGNSRALRKLLAQAQKTKAILSANKNAPYIVESVYEDTDFQTSITREDFEEMCSEMFKEMVKPIEEALAASNSTLSEIDHVELVGGAWRVPKVQQVLSEYIDKEAGKKVALGQHLNGEEAAAEGSVLVGANSSSSFRVKKIFFTDITAHEYAVQVVSLAGASEPWEKNLTTLFPVGAPLGAKKKLSFSLDVDFMVKLFEDGVLVSEYTIKGLADVLENKWKDYNLTGTPKVTVPVHLEGSGIIEIKKPEAVCEESYWVNETKKKPKSNTTKVNATKEGEKKDEEPDEKEEKGKTEGGEEKAEGDKEEKTAEDADTENAEKEDVASEKNNTENGTGNMTEEEEEVEIVQVKKKKKHEKKLVVETNHYRPKPMSSEAIKEAKKKLQAMADKEAEVQAVKEMSNELEAAIYSAREKVEMETLMQVSTEEQREAVTKLCGDIEEWTYEGSTEKHEYEKRLDGLKELLGPMEERAQELEARSELGDTIKEAVEEWEKSRQHIEKDMPWVNATKLEAAKTKVDEFNKWWAQRQEKQQDLPLHEAPAFTKSEVMEKKEKVDKEWEKLKKIKKPKEPKKPKKNATDAEAKKDDGPALPTDVEATEKELEDIKKKKVEAVENEDFDTAQNLKKRQDALTKHLAKLKEEL